MFHCSLFIFSPLLLPSRGVALCRTPRGLLSLDGCIYGVFALTPQIAVLSVLSLVAAAYWCPRSRPVVLRMIEAAVISERAPASLSPHVTDPPRRVAVSRERSWPWRLRSCASSFHVVESAVVSESASPCLAPLVAAASSATSASSAASSLAASSSTRRTSQTSLHSGLVRLELLVLPNELARRLPEHLLPAVHDATLERVFPTGPLLRSLDHNQRP